MLNDIQYTILKKISPGAPHSCSGAAYQGKSKLAVLLGEVFFDTIKGKVVIDFGCGGRDSGSRNGPKRSQTSTGH